MKIMKITDAILNLIFPRACIGCGANAEASFGYSLCRRCGEEYESLKTEPCDSCGKAQTKCRCRPTAVAAARVKYIHLIKYDSDLSKKLIFSLKRQNRAVLRRHLAKELSGALGNIAGKTDVTYAPRSAAAVREYGFDQSKLLAKAVSKNIGGRFVELFRHRPGGMAQKELGLSARAENAAESYMLNPRASTDCDTLVIVDDVITSGNTTSVLCELAAIAGAENIIVLTVAKTGARKYVKNTY